MKKPLKYFLFLFSFCLYGQTITETQKGWQTQYFIDKQPIPSAAVWPLLENKPTTQALALQAKKELRLARWIQAASGLVLGIQAAQWISGQTQPKWQWTAPAVVALGVSIPLERKGRKKLQKAINSYNKNRTNNDLN